MPRLSVDIDLVYLPIKERDESLYEITNELTNIAKRIEQLLPLSRIQYSKLNKTEYLYAGKIMAALDRQHPRDLFDVKQLIENEGFSSSLKETFLVYLISHNRRFLEILNPSLLDIDEIFEIDFKRMTSVSVNIRELVNIRKKLISIINQSLTKTDKQFLIEFKEGKPDWSFFSVDHIRDLPAVKWKIHNLSKISDKSRTAMVNDLKDYFEI